MIGQTNPPKKRKTCPKYICTLRTPTIFGISKTKNGRSHGMGTHVSPLTIAIAQVPPRGAAGPLSGPVCGGPGPPQRGAAAARQDGCGSSLFPSPVIIIFSENHHVILIRSYTYIYIYIYLYIYIYMYIYIYYQLILLTSLFILCVFLLSTPV